MEIDNCDQFGVASTFVQTPSNTILEYSSFLISKPNHPKVILVCFEYTSPIRFSFVWLHSVEAKMHDKRVYSLTQGVSRTP